MPTKKTSAARSKTKKTSAKKSSASSAKRKTAPKPTAEQALEYIKRQRFIKGIILCCLAFLCTLVSLMEGEKVWKSLHDCYRGIFGFTGLMVPVILIYCAVQMFRTQSTYRFPLKVFFFSGTVLLLNTLVFAFGSNGMELEDYGTELMNCYSQAISGFIGGILGIPLAKMFGAVAGGILAAILFLFFLYMSFEAIFMNLFDKLKSPVRERISEHKEIKDRVNEERSRLREEQRKKEHDEYVKRKVEEKLKQAKKRAAESEFTRIDKTPIYDPEHNVMPSTKTVTPLPKTEQPRDINDIIPDVTPNKKNISPKKQDKSIILDHVDNESDVSADIVDIAALVSKNNRYFQKEDPYEDTLQTVFGEKKPPSKPVDKHDNKKISLDKKDIAPANEPVRLSKQEKAEPNDPLNINTTSSVISGGYIKPPFTLLEPQEDEYADEAAQELHSCATKLVDTLKSFGVQTTIMNISRGPSVTRYELQPASGVKISKITNLADDIAMNLAATGVRIEAPIPGKNAVGIEVPNKITTVVKMRSLVESAEFQSAKSKLTVALGKDIAGNITLADLSKMPHLLIAGSTGSGKSVCINSMLVSLLYKASPDEVKLMLIDPKVVELGVYNGIPHLLVPVVTEPRKAAGALNWAVNEMLERYKTFAEHNVRDMYGYNRLVDKQNAEADELSSEPIDEEPTLEEDKMLAQAQAEIMKSDKEPKEVRKLEKMCQIVIVIDELADLMMAAPNEVEESICRLAQMARAAGMHLVIATQRPSVDVITGLIKANVPSRIAFAVKSQIDSRTILDSGGAEKLLGKGDMLFSPIGTTKPVRIQGCFVNDDEIEGIISFIKENKVVEYDKRVIDEIENSALPEKDNKPADTDASDSDPMMEQAIQCVVEAGQASTSLLQRRLRLGYARAGRLIDEMEQMGIVGPHEGSKPRQVLMTYQQWMERNMSQTDTQ